MADPLPKIRQALYDRLAAVSGVLATVYVNTDDPPPADANVAYQKVFFMPAEPDNSEQGAANYREHGLLQVSLMYPPGPGEGAAEAMAGLIRTQFKRGTSLTVSGQVVTITHTPKVTSGYPDGSRWHVPVTIRWQSWVAVA